MREMKNSGVPWIGEIPKGWMVRRIKTLFSERTELSETGNETLMSVSEYYGVDSRASHIEEDEHLSRSESLIGYKKCYPGDIVSNIMLAWKGSLGVARQAGIVSPAYCVYMPVNVVFPMYYHYLFRTSLYTWQFKCYSKGIIDSRLRLYSPFFYDIPALIPPVTEQRRIADFLDAKCAEIDSILEQTKASIEEYKALKQSVITEAVTKGIRGDQPMKDSGVEWIGEIPSDWEVLSFYKNNYIRGRLGWKGLKADEYVLEGFPFLSAFNIIENHLDWNELNYITQERYDESPEIKLSVGDLLVVKDGAGIGKCARVDALPLGPATVNSSLAVITSLGRLDYRFEYYYLLSAPFQQVIWFLKIGMGVPHLTQEKMREISIPCPSLVEQREIAAYLDEKCSAIDSLIASKEALIGELEAYKKSLIYEYVTGKKEVL